MSTVTARPLAGPAAWRGQDLARSYHLWLSMPNGVALLEGFEIPWGSIEPGAPRGGIEQYCIG